MTQMPPKRRRHDGELPTTAGFLCSLCGARMGVIDSRSDGSAVYRRRECTGCSNRITTVETDLAGYDLAHRSDAEAALAEARRLVATIEGHLDRCGAKAAPITLVRRLQRTKMAAGEGRGIASMHPSASEG